MPAENVASTGGGLFRKMQKQHAGLFGAAATFSMVAGGTGRDDIRPRVQAALVSRHNVIDCQTRLTTATVLAGIIVAPEYLAASQLYMGARAVYLKLKTNNRWPRDFQRYRVYVAPAVRNHCSLSPHN